MGLRRVGHSTAVDPPVYRAPHRRRRWGTPPDPPPAPRRAGLRVVSMRTHSAGDTLLSTSRLPRARVGEARPPRRWRPGRVGSHCLPPHCRSFRCGVSFPQALHVGARQRHLCRLEMAHVVAGVADQGPGACVEIAQKMTTLVAAAKSWFPLAFQTWVSSDHSPRSSGASESDARVVRYSVIRELVCRFHLESGLSVDRGEEHPPPEISCMQ